MTISNTPKHDWLNIKLSKEMNNILQVRGEWKKKICGEEELLKVTF